MPGHFLPALSFLITDSTSVHAANPGKPAVNSGPCPSEPTHGGWCETVSFKP